MRGPDKNPDSKRNSPDWESITTFCHPSTKSRLQHLTHLFKTAGFGPQDQSEALDEALTQWMNSVEPLVREAIRNQMEGTNG